MRGYYFIICFYGIYRGKYYLFFTEYLIAVEFRKKQIYRDKFIKKQKFDSFFDCYVNEAS